MTNINTDVVGEKVGRRMRVSCSFSVIAGSFVLCKIEIHDKKNHDDSKLLIFLLIVLSST